MFLKFKLIEDLSRKCRGVYLQRSIMHLSGQYIWTSSGAH